MFTPIRLCLALFLVTLCQGASVQLSVTTQPANTSSIILGEEVNVIVTVTPVNATGTPTGTITLKDGNNKTFTLSHGHLYVEAIFEKAGDQNLTVTYNGDSNYGAAAVTLQIHVAPVPTIIFVVAEPCQPLVGQNVTYYIEVESVYSDTPVPTGNITVNGQVITLDQNGEATYKVLYNAVGSQEVNVSYGGDANHGASKARSVVQVVKPPTQLQISINLNTVYKNDSVIFTVKVTAPYGGTPTGTVTFTAQGQGSQNLTLSGSPATATTTRKFTAGGYYAISAVYLGDSTYSGSYENAQLYVNNRFRGQH